MISTSPNSDPVHDAIAKVARTSYGRLLAWLAVRWRDVTAAEDALSDAFAAALRAWPQTGVPEKPESWLLASANRRLIDLARHHRVRAAAVDELTATLENEPPPMPFSDERLRLLFVCGHPAIAEDIRAPLMLQTVLGLDAGRIAAAWLVAPTAMSQRLVRAKNKIRDAGIRFQLPEPHEWPARLAAVLEAIYAAYGTGWDDCSSTDETTRGLTQEAIRLARALVELMPGEPEAMGLLALLLHCDARRATRRDATGRYVPLSDQNPGDWSRPLLEEAERWLMSAARFNRPDRFQWLAAVQSAHARRIADGRTDWPAIVSLYEALLKRAPTAGVRVAHVAAWAEVHGPASALEKLNALPASLTETYQPCWALRADLLKKLGRIEEARLARDRAADLSQDPAVRDFLHKAYL